MRKRKQIESSKLEKTLERWCHKYIRFRDLILFPDNSLRGYCISCNAIWDVSLFSDRSIMNGKKWHAGHYFKSDKYQSTRYNEDNIHLQCYYCNKSLSGNESNYQINLVKKIGQERFEELKIEKNKIIKFNIIELEDLIKYYKAKAKEEAKRLNIKL